MAQWVLSLFWHLTLTLIIPGSPALFIEQKLKAGGMEVSDASKLRTLEYAKNTDIYQSWIHWRADFNSVYLLQWPAEFYFPHSNVSIKT